MSSAFKMMLPTKGGKHFFKKMDKFMKERVCRALKAQRKQQMACEFHKVASAMHTILFADWALEAKNAQVTGHSETFYRFRERKKQNRTSKGAIGRGKVRKIVVLPSCWGSKKLYF